MPKVNEEIHFAKVLLLTLIQLSFLQNVLVSVSLVLGALGYIIMYF